MLNRADANTLIYLDFPQQIPLENPFLVQGWIISRTEIQDVWLTAPATKIPLALVERPDVKKIHATFPFVKGFIAWVDNKVLYKDELDLHYRLGSGEFNQTIVLKNPADQPFHLNHRQEGYQLLTGYGLEIGALHQPAVLPQQCTVEYCDVCSREEAIQHFPELNINDLVKVKHICDLDKQGLTPFMSEQFDFMIFNHVIEHIANPIKIVGELFRVLKPQGYLVISAPDKRFTYDKNRELTPFSHLVTEYQNNTTEVTEDHYLDFLRSLYPQLFKSSKTEQLQRWLVQTKNRREHAHVWDSQSFSAFMVDALELLNIKATCVFKHLGRRNRFEYFSVWQKSD